MDVLTIFAVTTDGESCTPTPTDSISGALPNTIFHTGRAILVLFALAVLIFWIVCWASKGKHLKSVAKASLIALAYYTVLWLGLFLIIGYAETSLIDFASGIILVVLAVASIISRFLKYQKISNRLLLSAGVFIIALIIWFIIASVIVANSDSWIPIVPESILDIIYPRSMIC